jgi:hypothetical protein
MLIFAVLKRGNKHSIFSANKASLQARHARAAFNPNLHLQSGKDTLP